VTPTIINDRRPRNPAVPTDLTYAARRLVQRYSISPLMARIVAEMVYKMEVRR
jgi:hypothetical protein